MWIVRLLDIDSRPISNSILPSGTNGGILSGMELRCECNFATSGVGISEASFGILLHSITVGKV
jgi:hypothetical protein